MRPAAAKLARWRESPRAFVRECLGAEPDAWQVEVLEAVAKRQRICLKASKGPGKSTVLAWIGWWFLSTRRHPKVVATSITSDNLRDNLWTELSKWQKRSPFLKATFNWAAERITCNESPETWWASARAWPKTGDATAQSDTLAGVHADAVLFLVDEAGGIPDAVVATAEAGLANVDEAEGREARLVLAGNPTQLSGPLYRACTKERALWWVKEISGDPDDPNRAPRVSVAWAREQIEKYGRENPWVLVNVFGQFPPGQSNTLLGLEEALEASRRVLPEAAYNTAPRVLGVDVARFGDDRSCILRRQGRVAFKPRVLRNLDTMQLAAQVALEIQEWKPHAVFVDQTGVGAGVVDRLRELGHRVIGVEFGGKATQANRYNNKRSEMWGLMAEWVRGGGCIASEELATECAAPVYTFDSSGRTVLESKDAMKQRGLSSPDLADALAVTFAAPVAGLDLPTSVQHRRARTDYDRYAEAKS